MTINSRTGKEHEQKMNRFLEMTGYDQIIEQLQEYTLSAQAREKAAELEPFRSERELKKQMRDTTQARKMLDCLGAPPLFRMERIEELGLNGRKEDLKKVKTDGFRSRNR